MKHELKKSVKDYVESQELSSQQLEGLTSLINARYEKRNRQRRYAITGLAAVIVLAVTLSLFWGFNVNQSQVSQLIAEEVAYNHLKMKPLEVSGNSLQDIRTYFKKLDFALTNSSFVASNNLQLMGGRYCSIQGEAAAQLHMQDEATGAMQIIYQAPYNKALFRDLPNLQEGQQPVRHFVNGIGVDVWVEKGILFARSFNQ